MKTVALATRFAFCLLLCTPVWANPSLSAEQWLLRMAAESGKVNCTGVVSYQYGDQLVSAKIYQRFEDGKGQRRLVYLDGDHDEVIHQDKVLKFVVNQNHLDKIDKTQTSANSTNRQDDVDSVEQLPQRLANLNDAYTLQKLGTQRVADREAVVIKMQPKDTFRYAHKLYIDSASALLLKSETISADGKLLERFRFVDLQLYKSALSSAQFNAKSHAGSGQPAVNTIHLKQTDQPLHSVSWTLGWKPQGYKLVSSSKEQDQFSSCTYSDGMSSFSVFIEPNKAAFNGGELKHGASVVLSKPIKLDKQNKIATVVGEIPLATAERIINAIESE